MKQPTMSTLSLAIDATKRSMLTVLLAVLGLVVPGLVVAQASVTLHQDATVYRAFYYDESDNLLHIEVVSDIAGRSLTPLFASPKQAAPKVPPQEGPAVLIGNKVRYAVYYGTTGPNQPKFQPGDRDAPSKPVAFERLSAADAHRAIECATKGEDACLFPKMCHCGQIGGCCCY